MPRITEVIVSPYNSSLPYYSITNEEGVSYVSNDLDALIRFFVRHTQRKATSIQKVGIDEPSN